MVRVLVALAAFIVKHRVVVAELVAAVLVVAAVANTAGSWWGVLVAGVLVALKAFEWDMGGG